MLDKTRESFSKLKKALDTLERIVQLPPDPLRVNIDAAIQRFEYTIELYWKALKRLLGELGREVTYPKEVLKEAYMGKLIHDEQIWIKMLEDRNNCSHTYNEDLANEIYSRIRGQYFSIMLDTYKTLFQKYNT